MGMGTWDKQLQGHHGRNRSKARHKGARRPRLHLAELENLESRTLLATIPAATATGGPQDLSGLVPDLGGVNASQSSSVVAVDPTDPSKLVTVWVDNDPTLLAATDNIIGGVLEAAYSINGGQNWLPMLGEPIGDNIPPDPELLDPTTSGPTEPYRYVTDPSLGFDQSGNFYILTEYHNSPTAAASSSGAVVLQKYTFDNSTPSVEDFTTNEQTPSPYSFAPSNLKVIYQWLSSGTNDQAVDPTMTVDDNLATVPNGVISEADPYSGNVYVSWASIDVNTAIPILDFNPNRIKLEVSSDGGNNFSPLTIQDINSQRPDLDGNGPTTEHDATPAITVAQGRTPSESGQSGDAGIPGGQVSVGWDDFGNGQVIDNTDTAGRDYSFGDDPGFKIITEGTQTDFNIPVSINNTTGLSTLDVTVNIVDSSDQFLGLTLVAPSGDAYTLLLNQVPFIGATADTGIGISGTNLGVKSYTMNNIATYAMGTTFDDNATRDIFDSTLAGTNSISGPAVGEYQPEEAGFGETLDEFLAGELAKGINGTWTLVANDTNMPPTTPPTTPNYLINWSLSFGRGLTADNDVILPGTKGLVVPGAVTETYSTTAPSSPIGIGPGIVMAEDNTLGQFSPTQGRIYIAFVGHISYTIDGIKNPATNTDIFESYSDDDGRTWNGPFEVNDDTSDVDGITGSNESNFNDEFDGQSQYQPAIAVDQTTGTVVMSWRDARNDPANTLVATYIGTSIDGGNTFSAQDYANTSSTAIDAITGQTVIRGPQADNGTAADNAVNAAYGFGSSMGLAVYDGQVYPVWAGNFDEATLVNGVAEGNALSIYYRPMVIAAGPRIVNSTMGPVPLSTGGLDGYQQAQKNGQLSFTVTFDRPINPPSGVASFTPADVQVFYHDTIFGDPSIPLDVLSVVPVASSGVGPDDKFGFTEFTVTFSVLKGVGGGGSGIADYTGTYSYLITPDDGNGNPIVSPIASFVITDVEQPLAPPVASTDVPLRIPISGTGGSGTADDFTTSTLTIGGFNNQNITGVTLFLSLTHQNASDLTITLTAPDGQNGFVYQGTTTGPVTFTNQAFTVNGLQDSRVDGTYTLTIHDDAANNTGELTGWSVQVAAELPTFVFQQGAPMDQNADGTPDENPLTLPGGYTGLTPGDVYAVPTPQLTAPVTFTAAAYTGGVNTGGYILSPPYNQNTVPLIVTGPQVLATQAVGTSGELSTTSDDLITDDSASQFDVTFDRPIQTSSFDSSQVLSIMGPVGAITGPQTFGSTAVDQAIPAATPAGAGALDSTVTINSAGTLQIGDITVSLTIATGTALDSSLTAVLVAPNGTTVPLFSGVGGLLGKNFVNTVFDDSAETSIAAGTAPFTGSYQPEYALNSATLTSLQGLVADGIWHLQITNTKTGVSDTLDSWSLNITPKITVTALHASNITINGVPETVASQFAISFPQQQLSGTYTIQLGPDIEDEFGDGQDPTGTAGLDVLRDEGQDDPTTTMQYTAVDLPKTIPSGTAAASGQSSTPGSVSSSIVVPDSFIIEGDQTAAGKSIMQVQLNLSYPNDPDLTATLYHYSTTGTILGQVTLFGGVGTGTNTSNFNGTVFDDNAPTPIQEGSAPFSATYNPQESLATVFAPSTGGQQGMNVQGTWTLVIQNGSTTGTIGTINGWSLTFQKSLPTSGLGEQGSDNASVSFRIFTLSTTDSLSSQTWTAVGPASSTDEAGQVNAIAVDPSDPSGNTVYVGGASGGVWKTTDFLTTSPNGPTWIPLTNFGPSAAINIASITIFPRNQDPSQSIIIAATGGDSSGQQASDAPGVGFLISTDGGVTWNLDDSTVNVSSVNTTNDLDATSNILPIDSTARDRKFVGTTAYQVTVDPELTPNGQVIIYAALSGTNGGIWRSENTGQTWTQVLAGNATSVVLDQNSGLPLDPDTGNTPGNGNNPGSPTDQGNYQVVFAGIVGQGVYMSSDQGQSWNLMTGTIGNPLIIDGIDLKNVNPAGEPNPNGAEGKIVLGVPAKTDNYAQSELYAGWLYAAVATTTGGFDGLFITKDFGENWTQIQLNSLPPLANYNEAVPVQTGDVNATSTPAYAITDNSFGNVDLAVTVDAQDPNITYLGGFGGDTYNSDTGLIRVDATNVADAHNLGAVIDDAPDFDLTLKTTGATTFDSLEDGTPVWLNPAIPALDPTNYVNFIRNPQDPFLEDATLYVENYASFVNTGGGASWTPFDTPTTGLFIPPGSNSEISGTGYQMLLSEVDPTTGLPRLIVGNLTGVYSGLDDNGTFESSIGSSTATPSVNRNGNLDLGQFYYGAVQPSTAAAQIAGALFYGGAENIGGQSSDPSLIGNGDIQWSALGLNANNPFGPSIATYTPPGAVDTAGGIYTNASGTAVDQQGNGTLFQYWSPGQGVGYTEFVQVNGVARTFGLLQASNGDPTPDPQWVIRSYANLVVNPVDSDDDLISSSTGNIFESTNQGETWFDIGSPATFGSPASTSFALAFGAPDPSAPEGVGNLGNFIYVGTATGKMYVSQNAGGNWLNISAGLNGAPIQQIIADPARGSHAVYAVTTTGIFYLPDSVLLGQNPTTLADEWVNITGGIKDLAYSIFGQSYNPATDPNTAPYFLETVLNSIAANWNYTIPNDPANLSLGYHPVLYVAANSGVYMSTDNGTTWTLFPDTTYGAEAEGGNLPHVDVSDLSLSQGNVATATGMPALAGPYQTFGFSGTLTSGSATVAGITSIADLAAGDFIAGTGIPAGTTILFVNSAADTITLSANATAGGLQSFTAANPSAAADPDLLLAATYGEGEFAINLAPMVLTGTTQIDPSDTSGADASGNPIVTTATPTIDGLSETSGFGNATWVTIVDETQTIVVNGVTVPNPNFGKVIGGFNPQTFDLGQSITPNSGNSTDPFGNFAIPITTPFGSNGLKTIEIYSTDDAGAESNKVTLTFTLNATNIAVPPPTSPPGAPTLAIAAPVVTVGGVPVTNLTDLPFSGTTFIGTFVTVTETWLEYTGAQSVNDPTMTQTVPASDINSDGSFNFAFQDFTSPSGGLVTNGTFTVSATATYTNDPNHVGPSPTSNVITFEIDNTTPARVTNFRLNPADDTGVSGDDVTTDRSPYFIGTTTPGYTVELFINGQTAVWNTAVAGATQMDADNQPYNFLIQLPFNLNNGETTLYVEVVDQAGNISGPSNSATVAIVSNEADYNGGTTSDPALFTRNTTTNQIQFIAQTPAGSAPPWFGPSGTPFTPSNVFTGILTSGSAAVTGIGNIKGLVAGQNITGTGIPAGTTILSVNGPASSITLSANSTVSGTGTLTSTDPANVVPFQADIDSDGLTDLVYYNLSTATWTIDESSNYAVQGPVTFTMGTPNASIPVVGYFSPNGGQPNQQPKVGQAEEPAVMTYLNGQDIWTIASSSQGNYVVTMYGQPGDIPVPGDYDGVGYDQVAIYRPSTAQFMVLQQNYSSSTGTTSYSIETFSLDQYLAEYGFGADLGSIVPVPGQYDNVAPATPSTTPIFGKTEAAVYDPVQGVYFILGPNGPYEIGGFQPGDIPAPADYLGNGSDQAVVYRPGTGQFIEGSRTGQMTTLATLGQSGDIPLTAPLPYRLPSGSSDPGNTGTTTTGNTGTTTTGNTGTTTTGTTTTGNTGSTTTGTSSSSSTTSGSSTSSSGQSGQTGVTPVSVSGSKHHKKVVTKKAHPKKPVKKVTVHPKKETTHTVKKVHVAPKVTHKTKPVVKTAVGTVGSHIHVVDLALEDVHVNLRSNRKHYVI
jgi:subtilisin-like proprotein convertase family protein